MKKLILLITSAVFFQITLLSQSCLPEGITFTIQEEIDNFQTNYPSCIEIEGDLVIGLYSGTDITNLNGLSVLISISGDLFQCIPNYPIHSNLIKHRCWQSELYLQQK